MILRSLHLIYFSPTGTTRKVLEAVAGGLGAQHITRLDLTSRRTTFQDTRGTGDDLAIIGTPVYTGRVPLQALEALQSIKAQKIPTVVIVVYGNRAYDDALLELRDIAKNIGFTPVAGAVFVGEHSFSTTAVPIAHGRPDRADLEKARAFGKTIRERLGKSAVSEEAVSPRVPGNLPYRERNPAPPPPRTDVAHCTNCGKCSEVCPMRAITMKDDMVVTEKEKCVVCCACVKNCPSGARRIDPELAKRAETLRRACSVRKEPEFFIA